MSWKTLQYKCLLLVKIRVHVFSAFVPTLPGPLAGWLKRFK